MKYFIMAWDDDLVQKKYNDFYFVADNEVETYFDAKINKQSELVNVERKHFSSEYTLLKIKK